MTTLFGRNPLITALIGVPLIVIGLVGHATVLPWIGGGLLVVGGLKAVVGRRRSGSGSSSGSGGGVGGGRGDDWLRR